ncbi:SUMO-activating enzyme subunit 1 [Halteromyces radiatus]|uniref:SUMO-activating enzyme subunit 1 n=1 Tax=Halteromyces radiatus TaxID=101107 RepID=UPI00222037AF|nr:SUMO-activating enzyme subunit 1 [Halteromyces radiatus]KAI8088645.1 SUMO-activating enzyme subunit 1 [Halteromyces radiatus]
MTQKNISKDEAAIYDRQIRLWGLEAQQRIGNANILIAGLRAISNEVTKNLVLAGIGTITLLDHTLVDKAEVDSQFFFDQTHIGMNKAVATCPALQTLNPRVQVIVDEENIQEKPDTYFESFDIVCLFHSDIQLLIRINEIRRNVKKPFYAADAFGWIGYLFCDLVEHTFIEERSKPPPPGSDKSQEPIVTRSTHTEIYQSLAQSLEKNWSNMSTKALKKRVTPIAFLIQILMKYQLKNGRYPNDLDVDKLIKEKDIWLQALGINDGSVLDDSLLKELGLYQTELVPVAAIVGGVLAQEVIKVLSAKELPVQNWFFYNGIDGSGMIHQL